MIVTTWPGMTSRLMSRRTSRSPKLLRRPSMRTIGSLTAETVPVAPAARTFFSLIAYPSTFTGVSDVLPTASVFTLKRRAKRPSSQVATIVSTR